jgi:methylglutaconyl-CoA hydratase
LAVRAAKKSIVSGTDVPLKEGMDIERTCYQSIIPTSDRLEGLASFREKRNPTYKGE